MMGSQAIIEILGLKESLFNIKKIIQKEMKLKP
jgi:hypothetical protein